MLTLNLPNEHAQQLCRELALAGRREIGGIVMGEQLAPGHFKVTEMTYQRHGGRFAQFVRSARLALVALQQFFARTQHSYLRFNYLGEWHSHPSFEPRPSDTDHAAMVDVACHQNTGANFVLLLIVRLDNANALSGSITVYLPDGTVAPGMLDIATPTHNAETPYG